MRQFTAFLSIGDNLETYDGAVFIFRGQYFLHLGVIKTELFKLFDQVCDIQIRCFAAIPIMNDLADGVAVN